jgi:hypothetical protein
MCFAIKYKNPDLLAVNGIVTNFINDVFGNRDAIEYVQRFPGYGTTHQSWVDFTSSQGSNGKSSLVVLLDKSL